MTTCSDAAAAGKKAVKVVIPVLSGLPPRNPSRCMALPRRAPCWPVWRGRNGTISHVSPAPRTSPQGPARTPQPAIPATPSMGRRSGQQKTIT